MNYRLLLLFLMLSLSSCREKPPEKVSAPQPRVQLDSVQVRSAEYAVYSVLLDSLYVPARSAGDSVLFPMIRDSTTAITIVEASDFRRPELEGFDLSPIVERYREQKGKRAAIDPRGFGRTIRAILVPAPGRATPNHKGPSDTRHHKSHGLVGISRVGFNDALDQAMLYWELHRNNLDAFGEFVFLKRSALGRWEVVYRRGVWVS